MRMISQCLPVSLHISPYVEAECAVTSTHLTRVRVHCASPFTACAALVLTLNAPHSRALGDLPVYYVPPDRPVASGAAPPGIVVLQEIWGVEGPAAGRLRAICDTFAVEGFAVALANCRDAEDSPLHLDEDAHSAVLH